MPRNVGAGGGGSTSSAAAQSKSNKGRRSSSSELRASTSKPSQPRPASSARTSPTTTYVSGFSPAVAPRPRPTSQPSRQTSLPATSAHPRSPDNRASSSRQPTPTSSAPSSRRSSVVALDSAAYRYSLNVGSVSRFPGSSTEGANQILRAAASKNDAEIDPGRASVGSTISRTSSRLSSRYTAEEVAPQRRPVYLALPSDPSAKGVWSGTGSTLVTSALDKDGMQKTKKGKKDEGGGKDGEGKRRNSKIMTSFPFPHPVTPRRRTGGVASADGGQNGRSSTGWRLANLNAAWQRLLTAIFAGPYERQLNREEQEDDRITQSIIHDIARRNGSSSTTGTTAYGTLPIPAADPEDPYGYRQLAGPHLLPSYTTDLVARRRERRRARSRARFQCMASWTIWTVSAVLVVIVLVLVFSFVFPDRLNIPNHSDEGDEEDAVVVMGMRAAIQSVVAGGFALMMQQRRPV